MFLNEANKTPVSLSHTQTSTHVKHTHTHSFCHLCAEMIFEKNVILIKLIKPPRVLCDLTSAFLWRRAALKPLNLSANHFWLCTVCFFLYVRHFSKHRFCHSAICKPLLSFSPAFCDSWFWGFLRLNITVLFVFSRLSPGLLSSDLKN